MIKGKSNYIHISLYPSEMKFFDRLSKNTSLSKEAIFKILIKKLMSGDIKIEVNVKKK